MKRSRKFAIRIRRLRAMGRAVGVAAALVVAVSGVTFAALQSLQAKLTGNIINTATANLQVSSNGINFSAAEAGFNFMGLIPGGPPVPQAGYNVTLKNIGDAPLSLKLAISKNPSNLDNVDLTKVNVILTPSGGTAQTFSLKSLMDAGTASGLSLSTPTSLLPGNRLTLSLQVSMAADAVSSTSADLNNFDLAFSGVAVGS